MKKRLILALSALCAATLCTAVGCGDEENNSGNPQNAQTPAIHTILNGGFESADLSGWTVEYGNAFDDSCVSSVKEFVFDYDEKQNRLPVNQEGNPDGRGAENYAEACSVYRSFPFGHEF